ncbi:kinase-like domain-containing protein [Lactarius deliciosus]|nr:kinase-like domain-containing protein [Lactarius deliciosus]
MSLTQNNNIEFDLTTAEGVLTYLATTPFASASAKLLSGGSTNFIFRLQLNAPHEGRSTLILKHARPQMATNPDFSLPVSRQDFEVDALRGVRAWLPPDARVTVPVVHHFDSAMHAVVMDDAGPRAAPLKAALLAGHIPTPRAAALGTALGRFLRDLHSAGPPHRSGGEAARGTRGERLRAQYLCVDHRSLPELGDEPLGVPEETLRVLEALAERRGAQIRDIRGDTLVMGDFWPGNIIVGAEEEEGPTLVVDWELARPGLAGNDVGQFCAELATLRRLHPERAEAAGEVLKNFVQQAEETRRVALGHFGVHLAVWTPRTEWSPAMQRKRSLVMYGVKCLVEGADPDRIWADEELVHRFMGLNHTVRIIEETVGIRQRKTLDSVFTMTSQWDQSRKHTENSLAREARQPNPLGRANKLKTQENRRGREKAGEDSALYPHAS